MKNLFGLFVLSLMIQSPPIHAEVKYTRGILEGAPSQESIRKDFMSGMPGFRSCHQENLAKTGHVGKVTMDFTIGKNGKAHSPSVSGDMPSSVKNCLIAVLVGIQFQPFTPEDTDSIKVSQPINFKAIDLTKEE